MRGQPPRRGNPPASEPPSLRWTLTSRSGAVTGNEQPPIPWTVEATASDEEMLRNEVQAQEHAARYGSVWVLRDPEGVVLDVWIAAHRGLVGAGPVQVDLGSYGRDWVAAWEGPQARADLMVRVAESKNESHRSGLRSRCWLAGAACARTALRFLPPGEERPRLAIEATEAWARGEADDDATMKVHAICLRLARDLRGPENLAASCVASAAAGTIGVSVDSAGYAFGYAEGDLLNGPPRAWRAMAPLVREFLPLPVLLLAHVGEDVPLGLRL